MKVADLNELLDRQARSWQQGERVLVETLLSQPGVGEADHETVCSLLVGEILLRRARGEVHDLYAEYLRRFPQHAAEVWEEAALPNWMSGLGENGMGESRGGGNPGTGVPAGVGQETESPSAAGSETGDARGNRSGQATDDTQTVWADGSTRPELPGRAATDTPPVLPDYELVRELGRGGFGTVWLARNLLDRSWTALKVLKPGREVEIEGIRAYRRCSTQHPHLLPILHVGQAGSSVYYTMPLADPVVGSLRTGPVAAYQPETLGARHRRLGPLSTTEAVELFHQVLSGLRELHRHGVVHSDVKPDNILRVGGAWRLGDLGLAVALETNEPARGLQPPARGTRAYWPPEGCSGTPSDDLYALARTIAQVWSKGATSPARPREGERVESLADTTSLAPQAGSAGEPTGGRHGVGWENATGAWPGARPVSQWLNSRRGRTLERVLARALSTDCRQRFGSARELARALPGGGRAGRSGRQRAGLLAAGGAGLAMVFAAMGVWPGDSGKTGPAGAEALALAPGGDDAAGMLPGAAQAGGPGAPLGAPAVGVVAPTVWVNADDEEGIEDELVDKEYTAIRKRIERFKRALVERGGPTSTGLPGGAQGPLAGRERTALVADRVPAEGVGEGGVGEGGTAAGSMHPDPEAGQLSEGLPRPEEVQSRWPELAVELEELEWLAGRLPGGATGAAWGEELFRGEPVEAGESPVWRGGEPTALVTARAYQDQERSWVTWSQRRLDILEQLQWDRLPWHRAEALWRLASARRDVIRRLRYWAEQAPPPGLEEGERQAWLDEAGHHSEEGLAEVAQAIASLGEEFDRRGAQQPPWRAPTAYSAVLRHLLWLGRQFELQANVQLDRLPAELERELQEVAPWLEAGRLSAHDRTSLGLHVRLTVLQRAECGYRRAELDPGARRPLLAKAEEELRWSRQVLGSFDLPLSERGLERWRQAEADVLQVRLGSGF